MFLDEASNFPPLLGVLAGRPQTAVFLQYGVVVKKTAIQFATDCLLASVG